MRLPRSSWRSLFAKLGFRAVLKSSRPQARRLGFESFEPKNMLTEFVQITISDAWVWEDDGNIVVSLSHIVDHAEPVSVDFMTRPGTATAPVDYESRSGRITFDSMGDSDVAFTTIPIVNDMIFEEDEIFEVVLSNPSSNAVLVDENGVVVNEEEAVITILDDGDTGTPPSPEIAVFGPSPEELVDGVDTVQFLKTDASGTRNTTVGMPVPIEFRIWNYGDSDLTLNPIGPLSNGFSIVQNIPVSTLAPGNYTTFTIRLDAAASGTFTSQVRFTNGDQTDDGDTEEDFSFTVTGTVDPAPPSSNIKVSINDVSVSEEKPDGTGNVATFTISLSQAPAPGHTLTVNYATADGEALSNVTCDDYYATSGSVTFYAGETSKVVHVFIIADAMPEFNERFYMNLSNPTLTDPSRTVSFLDSQGLGTIRGYPEDATDGPVDNGIQFLATGPDAGDIIEVRIFDASRPDPITAIKIDAYSGFTGGARVASGDINGDGFPDVITSPGPGGGPHVKAFDGRTGAQIPGQIGSFFAYDAAWTHGMYVAAADVNGDGRDDIITSLDAGIGPIVRVFSGINGAKTSEFFAYSGTFAGGVRLATGDVTGDGRTDIVTAPGAGGGPDVRIWSLTNPSAPTLIGSFFAYSASMNQGVYVGAGDINGDGRADIVTGPGSGAGPHVRAFNGADLSNVLTEFYAYSGTGGVRVSVGDVSGSGENVIITAPGPGSGSHVKMFRDNGSTLCSFFAYDPSFAQGTFVAGAPIGAVDLTIYDGQFGERISENLEESRGGFTVVNHNDTDGDAISDHIDDQVLAPNTVVVSGSSQFSDTLVVDSVNGFRIGQQVLIYSDLNPPASGASRPKWETKTIAAIVPEQSQIILGSGLSQGYLFPRLTTPGRSEIDLMRLDVTKHFDGLDPVILRVVGGSISLWTSPTKGDGNEIPIVNGEATLDLSAIPVNSSMTIWVEAVGRSTAVRDIILDAIHNEKKSDRVRATSVWAIAPHQEADGTYVGARHDRTDVAWPDSPVVPSSGLLPKLGLRSIATDDAVLNAISMQFVVGPEGIQYERDVVFDATRQIERQTYKRTTSGSWILDGTGHKWFPAHKDSPNDDTRDDDENEIVNTNRNFYSFDAAGLQSPVATATGYSYSANFREWLRVSFGSNRTRPTGEQGSRVSDVFEWHVRHHLSDIDHNGIYERSLPTDPNTDPNTDRDVETSLNNIAPGHIILGYDQP